MPDVIPNNKIHCSLSTKQVSAYTNFVERVVPTEVEPRGDQFTLSPEMHDLMMSAEFIAYVKKEWDILQKSHPCYQNDSGLCMATLWDNFENIGNNQYGYN